MEFIASEGSPADGGGGGEGAREGCRDPITIAKAYGDEATWYLILLDHPIKCANSLILTRLVPAPAAKCIRSWLNYPGDLESCSVIRSNRVITIRAVDAPRSSSFSVSSTPVCTRNPAEHAASSRYTYVVNASSRNRRPFSDRKYND